MRIQETVEVIDGDDDSSEVYIQLSFINSEFILRQRRSQNAEKVTHIKGRLP